ncbi:GDP-mannose 4,6-dehydratase, partial [candidate division KSB1 bacterium]
LRSEIFNDHYKANFIGAVNVLESIRIINEKFKKSVRVLLMGSASEYGKNFDYSLDEETEPMPLTHHGLSKAVQTFISKICFLRDGIDVIIARPSNIIGPSQKGDFVIPVIINQILKMKRGDTEKKLVLGNIDSERDFIDVRDVVNGVALLMEKGTSGSIYNLATNKCYSIKEVIDIVKSSTGKDFNVVSDKKNIQKNDVPFISMSYNKIRKELGWSPKYSLRETLKNMIKDG